MTVENFHIRIDSSERGVVYDGDARGFLLGLMQHENDPTDVFYPALSMYRGLSPFEGHGLCSYMRIQFEVDMLGDSSEHDGLDK